MGHHNVGDGVAVASRTASWDAEECCVKSVILLFCLASTLDCMDAKNGRKV